MSKLPESVVELYQHSNYEGWRYLIEDAIEVADLGNQDVYSYKEESSVSIGKKNFCELKMKCLQSK